ncbi:MAG: thioredoxin domain-containing protein [Candidatus Binatia bacterium]
MEGSTHRNRLASESSAYLLQHAANPVDWYPWGEEALAEARRRDRPILLSIGYSACHWCHVMERESFENPDIAALMNEQFVCIKVDREERPDLDHLYMKALQGMTGRGGWPMTVFLTPDARPFYAGTYYPPEDRGGMPGFPRVLLGVSKTWDEKRGDVAESAQKVVSFLAGDRRIEEPGELTDESLREAITSLVENMDPEHGGFGRAPKFPGTMALTLLMESGLDGGDPAPLGQVRLALDRMAAGGIRDHLGGGFHRYSVDRSWLVPHFEKMLYDQALLASLYTDASRIFGEAGYASVAAEILDYVCREMTSPEGGFYSAQDADSEGEEGKFFVWSKAEVSEVLGPERAAMFCDAYGLTDEGNFEGHNIVHRVATEAPAAGPAEDVELAVSKQLLLERRRQRVAPGTDRKVVADWNGLMISAMARGGRLLGREDLVEAAVRAARFVLSDLGEDGALAHVRGGGGRRVPGFLDDYAFLGRACLDLFEARPAADFLATALSLADRLLDEFSDPEGGGFYFTGSCAEALVARTCDLHDGAVPGGNSVAAEVLFRLWALTGEEKYRVSAQGVVDRFLTDALRVPYGSAHLLTVVRRELHGPRTVVILGDAGERRNLEAAALASRGPASVVIAIDDEGRDDLPPTMRGKKAPDEGALAWVCEGSTCSLPVATTEELRVLLERKPAARQPVSEDGE